MNIELRQLRYFVAVAEELHFGRAAQRLHMTQPPLSQAIQALESQLGATLFARTRRSVTLTPAGDALLPEARRLLLQAEALPALARRAATGESGTLSLAFVSIADYNLLPHALREFSSAYPGVQVALQEATTDVQLEMLAERSIDAGIVIAPLPDMMKHEIAYLPLISEPLVLALPEDSPALRHSKVSLKQVANQPLVIFPRRIGPRFQDLIFSCFHDAGIAPPRIAQEAIQMQTIVSLVSAGMGIALVPQSVSNLKRPGVEYRALKEASPKVEFGLAWRRDNASPVLSAFIELMRKKR